MKSFYRKIKRIIYSIKDRKYYNNIYLVYSMGKVGSSSVVSTIKKRLPFARIFQPHFLSDYWLKKQLPKIYKNFDDSILISKNIKRCIKEHPNHRIKIITLVREPIVREISDFFQNWKKYYDDLDNIGFKEISELIDNSTHDYTLNWFDTEFKNYLNFDIYSIPFNKEKGYQIYNLDKFDVLCIKLESLDLVYSKAISEFLELKSTLINKNLSSNKKEKDLYQKIKNKYKADSRTIETLYSSKYMRHFYTESDIDSFKKKWSKTT